MSIYTVNSAEDLPDPGPAITTLRKAITAANANPGVDEIRFAIPGADSHTIQPVSALPTITGPVLIDGYTQPGASPNTNSTDSGLNTVLMIELDGSLAGTATNGLWFKGGSSTVRGMAINGFGGAAILVSDAGGCVIEGNFIGTDLAGVAAKANSKGVEFWAVGNSRIGTNGDGTNDAAERSLISGNGSGVVIHDPGSSGNVVAGNFIGTDVTGTRALGNASQGVAITNGAKSNRVGTNGDGTADLAERNLIAASGAAGIAVSGSDTTDNIVAGNYVGTDISGTVALGNGNDAAIFITSGASGNRIGTDGNDVADDLEGNLISGNRKCGVIIRDPGSDNNVIAGNLIGTDASGTVALPNVVGGVSVIFGASGNRIGTDGSDDPFNASERNVISGNDSDGVLVRGRINATSPVGSGNIVAGNYIGTDRAGAAALPNAGNGIGLGMAALNNRIGTNADGIADDLERNIVSGNTWSGIVVKDVETGGNLVAGNYIGTDVTGRNAVPNGFHGVEITSAGTNYNIVGGAAGNLISGNTHYGLFINSPGTVVQGNFIGTDFAGTAQLGNGSAGIWVVSAGNLISANGACGVEVVGAGATGNRIEGNFIGTDISGSLPLGNGSNGVYILDTASGNTVGPQNFIAHNTNYGVQVATGSNRNLIRSNGIYGNGRTGIKLAASANDSQAAPTIIAAVSQDGNVTITGTLISTPSTQFTLEFFASREADPSGFGEGESPLGTATVATDAAGQASFSVTLSYAGWSSPALTAVATDPDGNSSEFSNSLAPAKANDAPTAQDELVVGDEDTTTKGTLNATDADGDNLTYALVIGVAYGSVVVSPDGMFSYTPQADWSGTDTFTYKANDGQEDSNIATVTITVNAVNDAPVAAADGGTTDERTSLTLPSAAGLLANDSDPDADDTLTVVAVNGQTADVGSQVTLASGALLTLQPDGSYVYDPNGKFNALVAGQSATDGFEYTIADSQGATATAAVTVTITEVDEVAHVTVRAGDFRRAGAAAQEIYVRNITNPDYRYHRDVTGNIDNTDPTLDLQPGLYALVTAGTTHTYGRFTVDYVGPALMVTATTGAASATSDNLIDLDLAELARVTILGSGVTTSAGEYQQVWLNPIGWVNRGGPGGDRAFNLPEGQYRVTSGPVVAGGVYGTFVVAVEGSELSVTATTDALVETTDNAVGFDLSKLVEVTVLGTQIVNSMGEYQQAWLNEVARINRGGIHGDSTLHLPQGTYKVSSGAVVSGGAYGTFTLGPDGSVQGVTATTGSLAKTGDHVVGFDLTKLAAVTVLGNRFVTAGGLYQEVRMSEVADVNIGSFHSSATFYLPRGEYLLSVDAASGPKYGTIVVSDDGSGCFTLDTTGALEVTSQGIDLVRDRVNRVQVVPDSGCQWYVDRLLWATQGITDALFIPDGTYTLKVKDPRGVWTNGTFTVRGGTVSPTRLPQAEPHVTLSLVANRPPTLAPIDAQSVDEGHTLSLAATATDADDDQLEFSLVTAPAGAAIDASNGVLTWTPADGPDTAWVTVRVADGYGGADTRRFQVVVNNVAPVAQEDAAVTREDAPVAIAMLANDSDAAGTADPLQIVEVTAGPANGSVQIDDSGTPGDTTDDRIIYTPHPDFNGSDSFVYKITDGDGGYSTAEVRIMVDAINDAPTVAVPAADVTVDEEAADTVLDVSGVFGDVDIATNGDILVLSVTNSDPRLLAATLAGGHLTLDYLGDQNGQAAITLTATDTAGAVVSTTFLVTVNAVNDAPTAFSQSVPVSEDGIVAITLSGQDLETTAANLIFTVTSLPQSGILKQGGTEVQAGSPLTNPPTLTFEPGITLDGARIDGFAFTVTDVGEPVGVDILTSEAASVTIQVNQAVADDQVTVDAGIVRIGGTASDDVILITHTADGQFLQVTINDTSSTTPLSSVTEVRAWGRAGNDRIEVIDLAMIALLHGGDGNDELTGGTGNDLLFGGRDNDILTGAAGNDFLVGGGGADRIVGSAGHDILVAGDSASNFTADALREITQIWAQGKTQEETVDDTLDETVIDASFNQLTGSSGTDWFIISNGDKVTDFKPERNDGDLVTIIDL